MNQVYFHNEIIVETKVWPLFVCHNPFMNQVYFHMEYAIIEQDGSYVIIPL